MPIIMDGKELANKIAKDLKARTDKLRENGVTPELIIVTASEDPASKIYVKNKIERAKEIGIKVHHVIKDNLTRETMEDIHRANIPCIVQMPFNSSELKSDNLTMYINPGNDVDGFISILNIADLAVGKTPCNYPATPKGIMRLLHEYNIPIKGKRAVVVGRSDIVGKPISRMLENEGATVTLCHSKTNKYDLRNYVINADIVVSAIGRTDVFTAEDYGWWIKDKTTFIDVGINRDENGKVCGDIDKEVTKNCYAYTPVPGSVGPMTVVMLCENVIEQYEKEVNYHD